MKIIKVLIIDDSSLIRDMLKSFIAVDKELKVVAEARDPIEARDLIKLHTPDVLTLDIEMPKMDGITFLEQLMKIKPIPVIMISTLTTKGADVTLKALELGAVDFIPKPSTNNKTVLEKIANDVRTKIKEASTAKIDHIKISTPIKSPSSLTLKKDALIVIGASTGGVEAIKILLSSLPKDCPPILIVQHIPPVFSASFAKRLNESVSLEVLEAKDREPVKYGHVYIAPGDKHLKVIKDTQHRYICLLQDSELVKNHKPSVETLFLSAGEALYKGHIGIAIVLTGMGTDGADAMNVIHQKGFLTIVQDKETSIVWGMPRACVQQDCVDKVLPIDKIAEAIASHLQN